MQSTRCPQMTLLFGHDHDEAVHITWIRKDVVVLYVIMFNIGRLLILGTGWAGFKLAKDVDKVNHRIHLVSPRNYFTFTPLLASASVGTLELRSAIEPIRQKDVEFYEAMCQGIDFKRKTITCQPVSSGPATSQPFEMAYDKLVIATGAVPNTFNVPGVHEHASFLRDITHARAIRHKLLQCESHMMWHIMSLWDGDMVCLGFEWASHPNQSKESRHDLLHFCIVGGGPTGVEFAGELFDFLRDDLRYRYPHLYQLARVSIFDAADRLLPTFDDKLSHYTMTMFRDRGIQVHTGQGVKLVSEQSMTLRDGTEVPFGMCLWSTGLSPGPLIQGLDLPKDRMQRILTDPHLHVLDHEKQPVPDVYAIGDCATIDGQPLPCTAQVAKQKAAYLAQALNRRAKAFSVTEPFRYRHRGSMAYVGGYKAVVDFGDSKRGHHRHQQGIWGWFIWRGAYMSMAESWRNAIKIPTYWALTWFTGRETSRF